MKRNNSNIDFLQSATFLISMLTMSILTFSNNVHANTDAINAIENSLRDNIVIKGEADPSISIVKRMEKLHVPGLSIAVIHGGKIDWAKGYGIAKGKTKVDVNTLFQAASISKPVAALAVLKLVEQGKLNLDTDVNQYLNKWKIQSDLVTKRNPLTLRHLLTHTAGLNVHGFPGYPAGTKLPSTTDVLNGKGNTDKVEVVLEPGSRWQYSGGGYTVMQKIVEDVTGLPFPEYFNNQILKSMGMTSSSFHPELPITLKQRASAAFDYNGNLYPDIHNDYPEQAAAGLWTTPSDLATYIIHLQAIMAGKDDGVLEKSTLEAMFTKHQGDWGLGPALSEVNSQLVFGHTGKNLGFTTYFKAFVNKGEGVVVMNNGDNGEQINSEIMTAISEYYAMGIDPRTLINAVRLPIDEIKNFTGSFKLITDVGYDGEYILELSIVDDKLRIKVPNVEQLARLVPVDGDKFISTMTGSLFVFSKDNAGEFSRFLVSDKYQYEKID